MTNKLEVGDVIRADKTWEVVSQDHGVTILTQSMCYFGKSGRSLKKPFAKAAAKGVSLLNKLKGSTEFVVVKAEMTGGGTGMGPHDVYPDGWEITACQLRKDGSYNEKGLKVQFYQSGSFSCMIKDVKPVSKMKQTFVPA